MVRRILTFVAAIAIVACIAALVYLNPQETTFSLTPELKFTLPVSLLSLAAVVVGIVLTFLAAVVREGRRALREWQVFREKRAAERHVELKSEARALALAGNYNKARALLKKATERATKDVDSLVNYAETYMLEGRPEDAKRSLEEGQAKFGNDPLLLFGLARAQVALSEHAAAVTSLERALSAYPTSLQVLETLRDALFEVGSWTKAADVQSRICELKPDDETERNRLLGARFEASRSAGPEEREVALRAILGIDPEFSAATIERAELLAASGSTRKALRLLEKAIARSARVELLDTFERLAGEAESDRVLKLYESIAAAGESDGSGAGAARLRAARYMLAHDAADAAVEILKRLDASDPVPPAVHLLWGQVHQRAGNWDLAAQPYAEALAAPAFPEFDFRCRRCRAVSAQGWRARCEGCGAWSTLGI